MGCLESGAEAGAYSRLIDFCIGGRRQQAQYGSTSPTVFVTSFLAMVILYEMFFN